MQNLELEAEVIQISMYADIVLNILKKHKDLSVCKTLLFSYLIKKEIFRFGKVYTAGNTQDIVYKAISLLGDKSEIGCKTTKGWQRNQNLYSYYKFFDPYFNVIYWKNCFICTLKNKKK